MSATVSRFVWYELMSGDVAKSSRFYEAVVGWAARDASTPHQAYTLLCAGDVPAAGILPVSATLQARGVKPHWTGYLGVVDLDTTLARIRAADGTVHFGPEAVPGVGQLAVVADPHGAVFSLLQPEPGMAGPPPAPAGTPGHCGWHELQAGNGESAFAFYAELFGWTRGRAVDMGPMGVYQTFNTGEVWAGGIMTRWQETTYPFWLYYFNVDSAEAAAGRIKTAGGTEMKGPVQVPGGNWIVQARDPEGAQFAVLSTLP
jgi:predicted enzyme related to lactoylglutathione lyase